MEPKLVEIVLDIHKESALTRADIAAIKTDLATHIKRTNIIETEMKYLHKQINIAHGAIALISVIGIIAGIVRALQ